MLRRWLSYLSVLTGVLIFHSYYTGWFSEYLLWFCLLLPVFSLLLSLPGMLLARLTVTAPEECSCKKAAQLLLFLSDKALIPLAASTVQLELRDRMTGQVLRSVHSLQAQQTSSVLLPTEHCTCWERTLKRGRVYDLLGLFFLPLRLDALLPFFVLPVPEKPDELPDLSRFLSPKLTPKPGGGFSEQHELREYRPGDPLRQIHWKLTAKTDKLIVREPMQAETGRILLTFDLRLPQKSLDRTLGSLVWLSSWMLEQGITHTVCWLDSQTLAPEGRALQEAGDWSALLRELLSAPLSADTPSIAGHGFSQAVLVYHVSGGVEGETAE